MPRHSALRPLAVTALLFAGIGESSAAAQFPASSSDAPGGPWRVVLDGVMGGLSTGELRKTEAPGAVRFSGELSLENNGGFAQIRRNVDAGSYSGIDAIEIKVRGDGRTYECNLRTSDARFMATSYNAAFETERDAWTVVRIPLSDFELQSFGRSVNNGPPLRPEKIQSVGMTLLEKRPGPYAIDVAWIRPATSDAVRRFALDLPERRFNTLASRNDEIVKNAPRPAPIRNARAARSVDLAPNARPTSSPAAKRRVSARRLIEQAIERGAPLFNDGNHEACEAIYEVTLVALRDLADDTLDAPSRSAIGVALLGARQEGSATDRAWRYRRALDAVYGQLHQDMRPRASAGLQEVGDPGVVRIA